MGLDVIGVSVAAKRVIGDDDMGTVFVDQRGQRAHRLVQIGAREGPWVQRRGVRHAGVTPAPSAAQKGGPVDTEMS
ncbi:Uncharacterised protein [Mycobacteroides abscessus subsp. abscessus]|nr:Uncharacterised protein [Mycobacteroides abscessus subsp. abscessus]